MLDKNPAIIMACPNGSFENFKRFPKALIIEMGNIQDQAQLFHFLKQFLALFWQATGGIRSLGIPSGSVMCRTYSPQPIAECPFQVTDVNQRVCAFQTQN